MIKRFLILLFFILSSAYAEDLAVRVNFKTLGIEKETVQIKDFSRDLGVVLHNESLNDFVLLLQYGESIKNLKLKSKSTISLPIKLEANQTVSLFQLSPPREEMKLVQ